MPILNFNHPITKGLVFDAPFAEGAGTITEDDAAPLGLDLTGVIGASGATWDKGFFGNELDFSAAASVVTFTTPAAVNSLHLMSVEALFLPRGTGGSGTGRVYNKVSGTGAPYSGLFLDSSTSLLQFIAVWSTTPGQWDFPITPSVFNHVVTTYDDRSTANVPIMYVNGINKAISSTVNTPVGSRGSDDTNLYIGNRSDGLRNFDGKIVYLRLWNRLLLQDEALALYTNPWQIYKKSKPQISR